METENTNRQNEARQLGMEETQELRDMKLKFQEILVGLRPTTNNSIEERVRFEKLKKGVQNSEITLREKCPKTELFLVQIQENTDHK